MKAIKMIVPAALATMFAAQGVLADQDYAEDRAAIENLQLSAAGSENPVVHPGSGPGLRK